MYRSIAAFLSAALLLAGPAATAQLSKSAPIAAGPAPAVLWCPPGQAKDVVGKCLASAPVGKPPAPLVLAAKPAAATTVTDTKPLRIKIAMGKPNGDCTTRSPNMIHDSRSPGGCAPCSRGRVPNAARQACVIPIPHRYRP